MDKTKEGWRPSLFDVDEVQEKRKTPEGKSYWGGNGAYSDLFEDIHERLAPSSGAALTFHGEIARCFANLNYENGNNGNCNAIDVERTEEYEDHDCSYCNGGDDLEEDKWEECHECGGSGVYTEVVEYDGQVSVTGKFAEHLDYLEQNLPGNLGKHARDLRSRMVAHRGNLSVEAYNKLGDAVGYTIETTENYELDYYFKTEYQDKDTGEWVHDQYVKSQYDSSPESEFAHWDRINKDPEESRYHHGYRILKKNEDGNFVVWKTTLPTS